MAKATSIKEALARFERESGAVASQAEKVRRFTFGNSLEPLLRLMLVQFNAYHASQVDLSAQTPSIEKMDASLGALKACR